VPLQDGAYENLIGGNIVTVKDGKLRTDGTPLILEEKK